MNSIEGRRGEVRFRPPFPPTIGLFGKPTVINNVETLMNIPAIIEKGASWFSSIGTPGSTGTKVFSVSGDVARTRRLRADHGKQTFRASCAGGRRKCEDGADRRRDRRRGPRLYARDSALLRDCASDPAPSWFLITRGMSLISLAAQWSS